MQGVGSLPLSASIPCIPVMLLLFATDRQDEGAKTTAFDGDQKDKRG